jgi:carboxymethylenebutenolidase
MTPGGGEPTINLSDRIHGTIYVFFGTQDPLIPINQIDQVEHALKSSNVDHRMFHYPATHGFFCDQRDSYDPAAAADAWSQVKELFGRLKNG